MELKYKKDFDMAQKRLEAWWDCEIIDRPCVQMTIPENEKNKNDVNFNKNHKNLEQKWMDTDYQIKKAHQNMKNTRYVGEAFPAFIPDLGPDLWATLYGADLKFGENTSWAVHFVEDWDEFINSQEELEPDFNNKYWQKIEEMTEISLKRGEGKFITGLPDFHPGADLLVSLRDADQLCLDLMEIPEKIKEINNKLIDYYPQVYNRLYKKIKEYDLGTTSWLTVYHSGKFYIPSSDFSALISEEMFNNIFLPGIIRQIEFLDRSIYHLDGPDALRHLDTLLDIDKLNGLQWVYGAGNGPSTEWIEVYKKIQQAGKCMQILVNDPEEVKILMEELAPEGLLFTFGRRLTSGEAEKVFSIIENNM